MILNGIMLARRLHITAKMKNPFFAPGYPNRFS